MTVTGAKNIQDPSKLKFRSWKFQPVFQWRPILLDKFQLDGTGRRNPLQDPGAIRYSVGVVLEIAEAFGNHSESTEFLDPPLQD